MQKTIEMEHILIGKDLLLKVDQIASALLTGSKDSSSDYIKVKLLDGVEWTIYANLDHSRKLLRSLATANSQFYLLESIKCCVLKNRVGKESSVSKEIKEIMGIQERPMTR